MKIKMGDYNQLPVVRITDFAYILGEQEDGVFLHKRQANGELQVGDTVTVFLYYDNQKRVTATMNKPVIDQQHAGFVPVVDANYRLGAFLDIGLQKDLLLSKDDLPFIKNEWPVAGDKIFAILKTSKNQLTAKPVNRYQIKEYLVPEQPLSEGDTVVAYNVYKAEEGNVFYTEQGHYIFVYFKHMRKSYRLGEQEEVTITIVKDTEEYNGTCIKQKELMLDDDGKRIIEFLEENDGIMPFTDKSSPESIMATFHMSKGAFKRALGTLYKNKLVKLEDGETRLTKSLNNPDA